MLTEKHQVKVEVKNRLGLHARPAALFVQMANKYKECEITVSKDGNVVNGKSIMGIMMLAAAQGSELLIEGSGRECREAIEQLRRLIDSKFGEKE
jgi:phosphotransferase system HPr (HPr) family protein